jgi:hypothetical protein
MTAGPSTHTSTIQASYRPVVRYFCVLDLGGPNRPQTSRYRSNPGSPRFPLEWVSENEKPGAWPGLLDADVRHPHRRITSK